jgi:type IX secretion system PorP/SprF family membrane protein
MKKLSILFLFAFLGLGKLYAQDPFFSQLYYAPGYINPSLLGLSSRCFSAKAITKAQYIGLYQRYRYSNFYGSAFLNSIKHGISVNYLTLKEGDALLATNSFSVAIGGKIEFNKNLDIAYGVQYSNVRKFINPNRLVFPDQLDKLAGLVGMPTAAIMQLDDQKNDDFSAGLSFAWETWSNNWGKKKNSSNIKRPGHLIGASVDHLTKPNYNFLGGKYVTPMRWIIHGHHNLRKPQYRNEELLFIADWMLFNQGKLPWYGSQFSQQLGIKVNRPGVGFVGMYYRRNGWSNNASDVVCLNFCFSPVNTATLKKSSRGKNEYGIIAQMEQPLGNVNYTSAGILNNNLEAGGYINSATCDNCFPKPIKYDRSFLGKIQKFWRNIFMGDGRNTNKTDCTQFINN